MTEERPPGRPPEPVTNSMPTWALVLLWVALIGAIFVLVVACGQVPAAYACGTPETPPTALDPSRCAAAQNDSRVTNGARWWSAPAADVSEPDEQPVPGQVLDGDWWDPTDRYETEHRGRSTTVVTVPRAPAPSSAAPRPTTAPKPSTPTTTRRR